MTAIMSTQGIAGAVRPSSGTQSFLRLVFAVLYTRLLVGARPPGMMSSLTGMISLVLLLLLVVFAALSFRVRKRYAPMLVALVAMLVISGLSFLVTSPPEPGEAATFAMRIVFLVFWIIFASQMLTRAEGLSLFARWCRFAVFLGAFLAIVQVVLFPSIYVIRGNIRAFGMMAHPVTFGMFTYSAMMFCEFVRIKQGRRRRLADWAVLAAGLVSMTLAVTQTAWMMLLITVFLVSLARFHISTKVIALPVLVALILGLLYALPFTRDVFSYLYALQRLGEIDTVHFSHEVVTDSVSWRVVNWKMSIASVLPQWYVGLGPGQAEYYNYFHLTSHSMPIEIFVEIGAFGLMFLALFLWQVRRVLLPSAADALSDARARRFVRAVLTGVLVASFLSETLLEQTLTLQVLLAMIFVADRPIREIFPGAASAREEPVV